MDSLVSFFPTPDVVKTWASFFEGTGIADIHLYHIVAGQAAALTTLNLLTKAPTIGRDIEYRPTLDQVEEWVKPVKDRFNREQMLQHVAQKGATWVALQLRSRDNV